MHDPVLVRERECLRDRNRELDCTAGWQGTRALDQLLEVLAVDVLEDDVLPAIVLAAVDHRDDVGMRELRNRAGFAPESLDVLLVLAVLRMENLERDMPLEQLVACSVDTRHPARTYELFELVAVGDQLTGHGERSGRRRALGHGERTREPPRRLRENRAQRLVPRVEGLAQLRIGDHKRAEHAEAARVNARPEEQEPAPQRFLGHPRGELGSRLLRRWIPDELDRKHRAEAADVP